jgi:hypothetical protein
MEGLTSYEHDVMLKETELLQTICTADKQPNQENHYPK